MNLSSRIVAVVAVSVSACTVSIGSAHAASPDAWGNGHRGGANAFLAPSEDAMGRISTTDTAKKLVDLVASAGGGTLRVQATGDQLDSMPGAWDDLRAAVVEGDAKGVKVQVTLRNPATGGSGQILSGSGLDKGKTHIKQMVRKLGSHPSFVLDTYNEGAAGGATPDSWAHMEYALVSAARSTGYSGPIVVEDSHWGGGLLDSSDSGLQKYASSLKKANGSGNPALIGSFHLYNGDSSRLAEELKAVHDSGFTPQIGEYGNANWNGNGFDLRQNILGALKANLGTINSYRTTVFPWMDMFTNDDTSKLVHNYGYASNQQIVN